MTKPKVDLTPYSNITNLWAEGYHVSAAGVTYQLADMPEAYLNNVINKFSSLGYDVSVLEQYLADDIAGNPAPETFAPIAQATQ